VESVVTCPIAVRVEEAARRLSIGRSAVFALIAAGDLPSFKVGRSRLVPVEALEEYVRRQTGA
jgi:excisionase family DNA binding protein